MSRVRMVTQSVAHNGHAVSAPSLVEYLKVRSMLNFAIGFVGVLSTIIYNADVMQELLSTFHQSPILFVAEAMLIIATYVIIETIVCGGVAGKYSLQNARAGMIPIWRMGRVVKTYA